MWFAYRYVALIVFAVSLAAFPGDRGAFGEFYKKKKQTNQTTTTTKTKNKRQKKKAITRQP